jgi:CubicO group peptidase (beta-lactamase class C family)
MIEVRMARVVVIALLALLAATSEALPQEPTVAGNPIAAEFPDTPAGRRAAEELRILNEGDDGTTRAHVEENFAPGFRDAFPIEGHVGMHAQVREESGGFDLRDVDAASPTELELTLRARRTGTLWNLHLEVEPEPPHRIASIGMGPAAPKSNVPLGPAPEGPLSSAEIAAELKAHLERLAATDGFSGVVLLEKDGEILLHEAHGEAIKGYDIPNKPDTKFNLGSMNKMFTAVAIAQLEEEGRLSYDDPIGKYLGREWVRPEVGERVRIHHLLTHTSGLGSYFTPEFMDASRARFRDVDDYRTIVGDDSLRFEPGTQWSYSNTGFLLLGAIVEAVTGESYYDYVREKIYQPAGMSNTDAYASDEVVPNLAIGYDPVVTDSGVRWRNNLLEHVVRGGPAGGGFSTAPDLLAFARALREDRLVSAETRQLLTTPKPELGSPEYGYGFGMMGDGRFVGHTGGFPGISAILQMDLDANWTLVILSNVSQGSRSALDKARQLFNAAAGG